MKKYIDKDLIIDELKRRRNSIPKEESDKVSKSIYGSQIFLLTELLEYINDMEVKIINDDAPEYGYVRSEYVCGKCPRWNVGDTLAVYFCESDREGEHVLGKVINIKLDEELSEWVYTLENGEEKYEAELLMDSAYIKSNKTCSYERRK